MPALTAVGQVTVDCGRCACAGTGGGGRCYRGCGGWGGFPC